MTIETSRTESALLPVAHGSSVDPTSANYKKAEAAAHDFEAMALDQMLQPMFATVGTDPLFGGGDAEKILQPMLVTEMAKMMEKRGGLGLSDAITTKMLQLQGSH